MAYCDPEDLILDKKIPVPTGSDLSHYITVASTHIDTELRGRYPTPIAVDQSRPGHAQDIALLRNIAAHLATGYFILAITSGRELNNVHEYGRWLIERAEEWIRQIRDGDLDLLTVQPIDSAADGHMEGAPLISQGAGYSLVDTYYRNFEPFGFIPGHPVDGRHGRPGEEWPFSMGVV